MMSDDFRIVTVDAENVDDPEFARFIYQVD